MHWTAFLAYRRFPANARVADDMACIGCGYNLRGLNVWMRCPECGSEVGNSVFLLARAEIVQRNLHTMGYTYFAPLALLLACLAGAWWPALVAVPGAARRGRLRAWAENLTGIGPAWRPRRHTKVSR